MPTRKPTPEDQAAFEQNWATLVCDKRGKLDRSKVINALVGVSKNLQKRIREERLVWEKNVAEDMIHVTILKRMDLGDWGVVLSVRVITSSEVYMISATIYKEGADQIIRLVGANRVPEHHHQAVFNAIQKLEAKRSCTAPTATKIFTQPTPTGR